MVLPKSSRPELDVLVDTVLDQVEGRTSYNRGDLRLALRQLVWWATLTAGLDVKPETVLRREVIDRFATVGLPGYTPASRGNLRSQLLRVAEVCLDPRLAPVRLRRFEAGEPTAPYTSEQLTSLRSWAAAQSTTGRRANAWTLLALGAGAGLTAREMGEVRARDITWDELGVQVSVETERTRTIPVLSIWAEQLRERAEDLGPASYVFRPGHAAFYPNLVSNFVARGATWEMKPQTQRLRSTWLVHHLNAGVQVSLLMQAAGIDSLEAFTRYVPFMEVVSEGTGRRMLTR